MSIDTLMWIQRSFDVSQARKRVGEIKVVRFVSNAKSAAQPGLFEG